MIWIKTDVIWLMAWASLLMLPPHHRRRVETPNNGALLAIADLNVMIVPLSPTRVAIEIEIVTEAVVTSAALVVKLCASSLRKAIARKVENADIAMMCPLLLRLPPQFRPIDARRLRAAVVRYRVAAIEEPRAHVLSATAEAAALPRHARQDTAIFVERDVG